MEKRANESHFYTAERTKKRKDEPPSGNGGKSKIGLEDCDSLDLHFVDVRMQRTGKKGFERVFRIKDPFVIVEYNSKTIVSAESIQNA